MEEAAARAEDAVRLYEENPNYQAENHAKLMAIWIDILDQARDFSAARRAATRSIDWFTGRNGEKHLALVTLHQMRGRSIFMDGNREDSYGDYVRAVGLAEEIAGENHPEVARALIEMVRRFKTSRGYKWADRNLQRAEDIMVEAFGEESPGTFLPRLELGKLALEAGLHDKAEERLTALLDDVDKDDADHYPYRASITGFLMAIARERGNEDRVDELWTGLLEGELADGHPRLLVGDSPDAIKMRNSSRSSGSVIVEYDIDRSGRVLRPRVVSEEGNTRLARVVADELENWRYLPAINGGVPVPVRGMQLQFSLIEERRAKTGSRLPR